MNKRPLLPGAGFWVLFSTLASFTALFAWAVSPSDFDRVRMAQARLDAGENIPLSGSEEDALEEVIAEYPGLAVALANGRLAALFEDVDAGCLRFPQTHLLVLPSETPVELLLSCAAPTQALEVKATGEGMEPVVAGCDAANPRGALILPASGQVRVVEMDRGGATAWSGEGCAMRVGSQEEVTP